MALSLSGRLKVRTPIVPCRSMRIVSYISCHPEVMLQSTLHSRASHPVTAEPGQVGLHRRVKVEADLVAFERGQNRPGDGPERARFVRVERGEGPFPERAHEVARRRTK